MSLKLKENSNVMHVSGVRGQGQLGGGLMMFMSCAFRTDCDDECDDDGGG